MGALELRDKLIEFINTTDESHLKKIASFIGSDIDAIIISDEHKKILTERLESHKQNPNTGKNWDTVKSELSTRYGL